FMALAAKVMRQLLVHHARRRDAAKRGGRRQRITLDEGLALAHNNAEVLAIHEALEDLGRADARKSQIIEMRYFGGLSENEIAEVLDISFSTVSRDIKLGLAYLYRSLNAAC